MGRGRGFVCATCILVSLLGRALAFRGHGRLDCLADLGYTACSIRREVGGLHTVDLA